MGGGEGQWGQSLRQNEKEVPDNALTTIKLLLKTEIILQLWETKRNIMAQVVTLQSPTCFDVIELESTHPSP